MRFETLFFRFLITFFAGFSTLLTLAVYGKFEKSLVLVALLLFLMLYVISIIISFVRRGFCDMFSRAQLGEWVVVLLAVGLTLLNAFFTHDLARGRDDMGYMAAAIKISETGSLAFEDSITYAFHPFRNIPDTENIFTSQFFPGYNVYLATWHLFGGLSALSLANTLIIFLALLSLYYVGKYAYNSWVGFSTMLFFGSSYVFFWFPRRTLSENIFLFLLWAALAFFLRGTRTKQATSAIFGFVPVTLLLLVRVEALPILITFFIIVVLAHLRHSFTVFSSKFITFIGLWSGWQLWLLGVYLSKYGKSYFIESYQHLASFLQSKAFVAIMAICVLVAVLFLARRRSTLTLLRSVFDIVSRHRFRFRLLSVVVLIFAFAVYALWVETHEFLPWRDIKMYFVFRTFHLYFLAPFIFGGLAAFLYGYVKKEIWLVIFVVAPFFVFLLDPFIALDQPWFMRRYYPTFLPLAYLLASIFLVRWFEEKRSRFVPKIVLTLVLLQLSLFYPIITFAEHRGVQEPLAAFASRFGTRDVFFMQPGWDWQQWAYALHYIYKRDVLPNLDNIDALTLSRILADHDQVYVISKTASPLFGEIYPGIENQHLIFVEEFSFRFLEIMRPSRITHYVEENDILDVGVVTDSLRGTPPVKFFEQEERWYIYRLRENFSIEAAQLLSAQILR